LTLGLVGAAGTARYQRAALLEVVRQDFVRTARAKGLPERRVLLVHALRNALLPLITLFGLTFPFLLTGAVLVETVFAWLGGGGPPFGIRPPPRRCPCAPSSCRSRSPHRS